MHSCRRGAIVWTWAGDTAMYVHHQWRV